jgi:2TM domain
MDQGQQDKELWKLAKKRASFRRHLIFYFVINAFLWAIWWLTSGRYGLRHGVPWPVWVMLGWGVGLAFNYFRAYGESGQKMAEKEYEKLKKEKE